MSKQNLISQKLVLDLTAQVPESGCWLYTGYSGGDGYGRVRIAGRGRILVHRIAYEAYYGVIPDKLCVLHKCDVRSCMNPEHLFLGTYEDNNQDRANKNRSALGERSGKAKLSDEQVIKIRESAMPYKQLADLYNVSLGHIKAIRCNRRRPVRINTQLSRITSV